MFVSLNDSNVIIVTFCNSLKKRMSAILDTSQLTNLYNEISTGQRSMDWFLLGYIDGSHRKIGYIAKGDMGIEELKNHLNEQMVGYAYIKIPAENPDNFNDVDFVHLTFIGQQVKPEEKARSILHRLDIRQQFPRYLTEIMCNGLAEVTKQHLEQEVAEIRGQLNT